MLELLARAALAVLLTTPHVTAAADHPVLSKCAVLARPDAATASGLPLPRFVSLRFSEVNVRLGPDPAQSIQWVYARIGLPVMVIAEHYHWRRICDHEGATGWVHSSQLSGSRTLMVERREAPMRMMPEPDARVLAVADPGAILRLERCRGTWCLARAGSRFGWLRSDGLWGILRSDYE